MRLSSKGRYSSRAMLDLAFRFRQGLVQVKDISSRQQISEQYLEQLFIPLRRAGLVKGIRGAGGGFTLAKPPAEIRLDEIIRVAEGSVSPARCVDEPELCPQSEACLTRKIWAEIGRATSQVLEAITLQDLVEQQEEREAANKRVVTNERDKFEQEVLRR